MDEEDLAIRQKLKDNFEHYALKCLKIRTKSGDIEPLILNKAQSYVHAAMEAQLLELGMVRVLLLKGRQQGMSTMTAGRFYHKVSYNFGRLAFILAHDLNATGNLYDMAHRYHEHTPAPVKPMVSKSNAKELVFGILESGYKLGTSENKNVGRSMTIQYLHGSEVAFWKNTTDHSKGVLQAVPNAPGTEIILESTANGVGNWFHKMWQDAEAGLSEYIGIFVPWFWQREYVKKLPKDFKLTPQETELATQYNLTSEQINWRRTKVVEFSANGVDGAKAFKQEYPCCAAEAFILSGEDNYIPSDVVTRARKTKNVEGYGALVIGVDPARFGDDRSCILRRRGRLGYGLESHVKKDTMEITGIVYQIILKEKPAKVCIDIGGLGAGVYDRLRELVPDAHILVAVNFGAKPFDGQRYRNKKAEMWGGTLEWLNEEPCQIPDSDELHADLCNTKYKIDSNSRLEMESKAAMKKRGIRSSDCADALALTFALPESAFHANKKQDEVLNLLNESFDARMAARNKSGR